MLMNGHKCATLDIQGKNWTFKLVSSYESTNPIIYQNTSSQILNQHLIEIANNHKERSRGHAVCPVMGFSRHLQNQNGKFKIEIFIGFLY